MNLYEINQEILSLVDAETGEILDYEAFAELQMEKDQKIKNLCLWIKNLMAEAKALEDEEKRFAERKKRAKSKAESLKRYVDSFLQGESLKTTEFVVSYRKSEQTKVDDISLIPPEYLKEVKPEANLTELKKAIKAGQNIPGCHLETVNNISIS